jgi:hypothetical protein
MKVQDPRKRRRLAKQVAAGELSLVKLRQRIEGKPRPEVAPEPAPPEAVQPEREIELVAVPIEPDGPAVDDVTIDEASEHLSRAVAELADALVTDVALGDASSTERQQFAKYLTLAKIKLENAIAVVRVGESRGLATSLASSVARQLDAAPSEEPYESPHE